MTLVIAVTVCSEFLSASQVGFAQQYTPAVESGTNIQAPHWLFNGSCSKYICIGSSFLEKDNKITGEQNYSEILTYEISNVSLSSNSFTLTEVMNSAKTGEPSGPPLTDQRHFSNYSEVSTAFAANQNNMQYFNDNQMPPNYDLCGNSKSNVSVWSGYMFTGGTYSRGNVSDVRVAEVSVHETNITNHCTVNQTYSTIYSSYSGLMLYCSFQLSFTFRGTANIHTFSLNLESTNTNIGPSPYFDLLDIQYLQLIAMPFLVIASIIATTYYFWKK
ncbi:MAG: hypothetical protein ACP5OC_00905 [Thermoplasmata archaeon]